MNPPPDGPRRRPGVLVELTLLLLWFLLFTRLDAAVGRDVAAADANALALQSIEHAAHLDIERSPNGWLAGHPILAIGWPDFCAGRSPNDDRFGTDQTLSPSARTLR